MGGFAAGGEEIQDWECKHGIVKTEFINQPAIPKSEAWNFVLTMLIFRLKIITETTTKDITVKISLKEDGLDFRIIMIFRFEI